MISLSASNNASKNINDFSDIDEYRHFGLYSRAEFLEVYKKELKRSYRTKLPLTLMTINIVPISDVKMRDQENFYHDLLKNLLQIVSSFMRVEDVANLNARNIINILLLDTSIEQAQLVKRKITQQLLAFYNSLDIGDFKEILSRIKFNLFPLNKISGIDKIEATPVYKTSQEFEAHLDHSGQEPVDSLGPSFDFNLKSDPTELGTLALKYPVNLNKVQYFSKFYKRSFDICASVMGILFLSPILITIAIAIKLTSKGPVFYMQERLGESGKPFLLYKFRTMKADSDDSTHREFVTKLIIGENSEINTGTDDDPHFKLKKDSRITKIGSLLRKTSFDEIPQLINIIKGEMSVVGPRPPIPYEVEAYKSWHLHRILEAKPGLTGLWQTSGKNSTTFEEMVRLDLQYIKRRSTWLDMKIIFRTIPAMLNKDV